LPPPFLIPESANRLSLFNWERAAALAFRRQFGLLKQADFGSSDQDAVLLEPVFKLLPVIRPPILIELFRHDFEDDHRFALFPAAIFLGALSWGAGKSGQTAELLDQVPPHLGKIIARKGRAVIIMNRKKDFDEMHSGKHARAGFVPRPPHCPCVGWPTLCASCAWQHRGILAIHSGGRSPLNHRSVVFDFKGSDWSHFTH
jgi:hypothetical protein